MRGDGDEKGVFSADSCRSSCKNHFNKYVVADLRSVKTGMSEILGMYLHFNLCRSAPEPFLSIFRYVPSV